MSLDPGNGKGIAFIVSIFAGAGLSILFWGLPTGFQYILFGTYMISFVGIAVSASGEGG